jgi:hypothetical protein
MHKVSLLLFWVAFSSLAITGTAAAEASTPRIYIMMKGGKLSEMVNGKKTAVTQDVTLVNGTTIHPNGTINDRDGHERQLREGEYMTMDGKIRKLKDMGGKPAGR